MSNELFHHGIKGQKWGIRRFQNKDGTRTALGKKRRPQSEAIAELTKLERNANHTRAEHDPNDDYYAKREKLMIEAGFLDPKTGAVTNEYEKWFYNENNYTNVKSGPSQHEGNVYGGKTVWRREIDKKKFDSDNANASTYDFFNIKANPTQKDFKRADKIQKEAMSIAENEGSFEAAKYVAKELGNVKYQYAYDVNKQIGDGKTVVKQQLSLIGKTKTYDIFLENNSLAGNYGAATKTTSADEYDWNSKKEYVYR